MNKTTLRSELSKVYGITLSPSEFKSTSVAELENMIVQAKAKAQNDAMNKITNNEGVVNMNNTITVEGLMDQLNSMFANANKQVVANVNNFTAKVGSTLNDNMNARFDSLEAKVDKITQMLSTTKPAQAPKYNTIASIITPVGEFTNDKGQIVEYYGICSECGEKITSKDVVAYCIAKNNGVHVCYHCQQKAKANKVQKPSKPANLTHKCGYCNNTRTYASVEDMIARKKAAHEAGYKTVICVECARKLIAKSKAQQEVASTNQPQTPAPELSIEQSTFVPASSSETFDYNNTVNQGF